MKLEFNSLTIDIKPASKGNKTSAATPLIFSLVLSVGIIVLYAYYISLMTYM